MNIIKQKICDFGNFLMSVPNGEKLILDSFALMYISLKARGYYNLSSEDSQKYLVLEKLFEEIGVVPYLNESGSINYKIDKEEEKVNTQNKFFKRRIDINNDNKNIKENGERELINDILFNLEDEIENIICFMCY